MDTFRQKLDLHRASTGVEDEMTAGEGWRVELDGMRTKKRRKRGMHQIIGV